MFSQAYINIESFCCLNDNSHVPERCENILSSNTTFCNFMSVLALVQIFIVPLGSLSIPNAAIRFDYRHIAFGCRLKYITVASLATYQDLDWMAEVQCLFGFVSLYTLSFIFGARHSEQYEDQFSGVEENFSYDRNNKIDHAITRPYIIFSLFLGFTIIWLMNYYLGKKIDFEEDVHLESDEQHRSKVFRLIDRIDSFCAKQFEKRRVKPER